MANLKVSEMTEATSFDDGDYTMIVQANQSKKISKENILGGIESDISDINTNIGNMTNLETPNTNDLVSAINTRVLKKLWENSNSTISFDSQTITLESDDYDYLIWVYGYYKNNLWQSSTFSIKTQDKVRMSVAGDYNIGATYYIASIWRFINKVSDTEYTISSCNIKYDSLSSATNNDYIIPICIFGGKF